MLSIVEFKFFYATSSCSIKTKKSAKQIPGKTSVTIGVKIGGKNDAVIVWLSWLQLQIKCSKTSIHKNSE